MPTISQRIAGTFAVLCDRYGDVTKLAQQREQSRQSFDREWLSIHCRACGGVGDDRERSLSLRAVRPERAIPAPLPGHCIFPATERKAPVKSDW